MKFKDRLKALGFDSYEQYLASPLWAAFKQAYRDSDKPKRCHVCASRKIQLHHHTYERLGAESLDDVTPLCRAHHIAVHDWLKVNDHFVGYTAQAVRALKGQPSAPRPQPAKRYNEIADLMEKINKLPVTKRQRQTAQTFCSRRNVKQLKSLLKTCQLYVEGLQSEGASGKKKRAPKKPRIKREHRARRIPVQQGAMAIIKSLIARGSTLKSQKEPIRLDNPQ